MQLLRKKGDESRYYCGRPDAYGCSQGCDGRCSPEDGCQCTGCLLASVAEGTPPHEHQSAAGLIRPGPDAFLVDGHTGQQPISDMGSIGGPLFDQLPHNVLHKIGSKLQSINVPFLPELAFVLEDWLYCWGSARLFHILEDDRPHFQTPALQRFEQMRRDIRNKLVVSIKNL